jgi:hypothetical protein
MSVYLKCIKCEFRYVTDKARENYVAEGLKGDPLLCLHCIGEITGKVMNRYGYLVPPHEADNDNQRMQVTPKTITGCRPCMKKRGLV